MRSPVLRIIGQSLKQSKKADGISIGLFQMPRLEDIGDLQKLIVQTNANSIYAWC
jgi:hypothetical protein